MTTTPEFLSRDCEQYSAKWDSITASSPAVVTATKYFQANIGSVTSIDQLLSNTRLFDYAMTAFGLGSMTYAKGMMRQVLEQGVSSSTALANTLNNPNIKAFATAFNFAGQRRTATTQSSTLQTECGQRLRSADARHERGPAESGRSARTSIFNRTLRILPASIRFSPTRNC